MKSRIGPLAPATFSKAFLLAWLLAGGIAGFAPAVDAAQQWEWRGTGDGVHWSDRENWTPIGVPRSGDDLVFSFVGVEVPQTEMVNDLTNFTVRSMYFSLFASPFADDWTLDGNELTVTGGIIAGGGGDEVVRINCGLRLGGNAMFSSTPDEGDDITLHFDGPIDLNGYDLEFFREHTGRIEIKSAIGGQGNVRLVNAGTSDLMAVFGGSQPSTFSGSLTVDRLSSGGVPGARVSFDKPGGPVVHNRLVIGDDCEVAIQRADQIGDAAVSLTGGGRLLLNGHSETIRSLALTNVSADADPTLVDATGTTLTVRDDITTSVFNPDGHIPIIKGTLALTVGQHSFDLNNQLLGPGLDLQAQIAGLGGFSKTGNGTLALTRSNSFLGPVSVDAGILDLQNTDALGATASGLTVTDGSVTLRNVFIHGETLFVRGTRPVTANTAGSFLNSIGFSGWFGRVELFTNLVVNSTDLCLLGGPIVGPGGFEFLGSRHQILGSGSSSELSDFSGLTRALCDELIVSRAPGFRGDLIVGGGFSPRCEVRWSSPGADRGVLGFPRLTIHTNGLVNVNGEGAQFLSTDFHGGRVSTGGGTFTSGRVTVHPTNVTAIIEGNLELGEIPTTTFIVHDGPASPDLSINAVISDEFFGPIGIDKAGNGQMDLHRANTYFGSTRVRAGTLSLLNNNALGATSQGTTVENGATVAFGVQVTTLLEPLTVAGLGVGGTAGALRTVGDVFINTNLVLGGGAAIRTEGTNSRIQMNNVSGTGPLTKLGSGRLVLRGNAHNTYSGDTLVTEGVLDLAKPNNITSVPGHLVIGTTPVGAAAPSARVEHRAHFTIAGSVTVNAGGLWDLNGAFEDWLGANLQGRPPLTLNDGGDVQTSAGIFVLPSGGDIVVNPGSQRLDNSTITGRIGLDAGMHRISVGRGNLFLGGSECNVTAAISENGGVAELEKDGGGTLRLAGTNTHRGATRVTGGTLQVDGVQPQSAARVFDGGRLQGVGTVGLIEMLGATAAVAPGATPTFLGTGSGILTCSNFNSGAVPGGVLFVKLNGTTPGSGHDQINARGSVRLTGLTLQGSLGFASSLNQQFTIINNDGTDPIQGTFDGLAQDASVYLGGERFTVSYTGGTGNDVVLTRQVTPQLVVTTLPATEVPNFALDFDGRFNRVHVGTNPFPAIVNNFTIELWANPTASRLETHEANLGISDLTSQRYAVFPDHGDFGYGAGHAGAGLSIGTNGISVIEHAANQLPTLLVYSNAVAGWTHVALVFSNRFPRLYVNGALARIGLPSVKNFVHPSANLGGSIQGLTYGNFQGQLDEVRIWSGVLSQGQIQTNLNRVINPAQPGLLLYYRCEETNGAPLVDSAPTAPNISGTLLNGVASIVSGALPPAALNGPTVTLNGVASPGGLDASMWFEWGATTNYGNVTATQSVSAVTRAAGFSQTLAGLAAGVYQYRAVGSNGLHFSFAQNQSFTLLNGAPLLSIEAAAIGQIRLLWPTSAVGFTLQANADLNTANWSSAGTPPTVVGTNNAVLDSTTSSQRFYRLFHP
jgi:autotransporter-associated beta strand protein